MLFVLFINIFSLSFQTIPTTIFCDDELKEVFVVEGNTPRHIAYGSEASGGDWEKPYIFNNLNVVPGDLIRFKCYNIGRESLGGGCFFMNNQCNCYEFNNVDAIAKRNINLLKTVNLGSKSCEVNIHQLVPEETHDDTDYYYEHYIPIDASKISCINNDDVLIYLNGLDYNLKLSDYITADFNIKNFESTIIDYYSYFKFNNKKLEANQLFKVTSDLTFNSNNAQKIYIKFKNYGKILAGEKECGFFIRVCNERCSNCYDSDISENNHQCIECKDGYYHVKDTYNCVTKEEMIGTVYSFDEKENIFKICDYYIYYKLLNELKYCTYNYSCPTDFNKLIPEKNQCINSCSKDKEYKYEFRNTCYRKCPINISVKSKTIKYYCEAICNKDYPFEIIETQDCVSSCSIKEIDQGICKLNYKSKGKEGKESENKAIENVKEEMTKDFETSEIDKGKDIKIELENSIITISTSDNQKNSKDSNETTIDLGECENKLKEEYNISKNKSL